MIMSYSKFTPKVIKIGLVIGDINKCTQLKDHEEIPKILPIGAVLLKQKKNDGEKNLLSKNRS